MCLPLTLKGKSVDMEIDISEVKDQESLSSRYNSNVDFLKLCFMDTVAHYISLC